MRISAGKIIKGLACISMLWFSLSLWYSISQKNQQSASMDDAGSSEQESLNSGIKRLLVPRVSGLHYHPLVGGSGNASGRSAANSDWSYGDPMQEERQLREWRSSEKHYCSHNLLTVPAGFARLKGGVIVNSSKGAGRKGGEEISEVLNQSENSEYWTLKPGAFRVVCPEKQPGIQLKDFVGAFQNPKSHLNLVYLPGSTTISDSELHQLQSDTQTKSQLAGPVLAITRYEYANLYHTMTDFYNAFVACVYYGIDPANATVLIVDGHPKGSLDGIWSTLFGRVVRIGELKSLQVVDDLIWVMMSYDAPLHQHNRPSLPLHEPFRRFFLSRHGLPFADTVGGAAASSLAGRNCTGLRLLFVWRRNYVAHPRNPRGSVVRKIANEEQLLAEAQTAFSKLHLRVSSAALENMDFRQQLKLISGVQILAGMHGAALSHTLFLPPGSALMELYPNYWSPGNIHFRAMARWRGLAYDRWVNSDPANELPDHKTRVPQGVVTRLLNNLLLQMGCSI
ncbi:hypothetical protein BOX15_Mlig012739g5 [Macrostomum lignano]|uniref:EGF domain-specific O-linked N-acetylglucosamine transferase n=1 Tax=Macrostomum lignano TaxID=282301 RepID=A0A267GDW8_9PLAT|nr:hypothetical protein BOX15_Mlig012739g5 [Macrostomum lignano]